MCVVRLLLVTFTFSFSLHCHADYRIAVNQLVNHPSLDSAYQGLIDGLKENGIDPENNLSIDYAIAHGDLATSQQIAKQQVASSPDALVTFSTPSAQITASINSDIPMIFAAVSNPTLARLEGRKNITGVSALSPVKEQINIAHLLFPQAKKVGVIYNPGEDNSQHIVELLEQATHELGLKVIHGPITSSTQAGLTIKTLIEKVDVLYLPTDNTVASALPSIIHIAQQRQVPTIGGTLEYVDAGATFSFGFEFYQNGKQAAQLVTKILKGLEPSKLPIEPTKGTTLYVNQDAFKQFRLTLPESISPLVTKTVYRSFEE